MIWGCYGYYKQLTARSLYPIGKVSIIYIYTYIHIHTYTQLFGSPVPWATTQAWACTLLRARAHLHTCKTINKEKCLAVWQLKMHLAVGIIYNWHLAFGIWHLAFGIIYIIGIW